MICYIIDFTSVLRHYIQSIHQSINQSINQYQHCFDTPTGQERRQYADFHAQQTVLSSGQPHKRLLKTCAVDRFLLQLVLFMARKSKLIFPLQDFWFSGRYN